MIGDIEIRHLRYFLAVAEELHFGRAAKRLHMAQPPLSQQIRQLEELLGYPLFLRSSRSVKLTAAGEALAERVSRTMMKLDDDFEAGRSVARGEQGSLTVGFVGSAMLTELPMLLGRYRTMFPGVDLRLREIHTSQLVLAIRDGSVDVGLLRDVGPEGDMKIEAVVKESFIVVLPKGHSLAKLKSVPVARLRDEPFVFYSRSAGSYAWQNTMRLCEKQGFLPKVVQEASHWLTMLRLIGAGLGVTIAPSSVERIAGADVACRKLSPDEGETTIDLVYRSDQTSPLVDAFSTLVRDILAH